MGFHKKYISNELVIYLFNEGGISAVVDRFSKVSDSTITESGLSTEIMNVLNDLDWQLWDPIKLNEFLIFKIHKELNVENIQK
jgi:hypothetical protein